VEPARLRVLREQVPAALRAAAVRRNGDDGLQLHVVVQASGRGPGRPDGLQIGANALLPDEDATSDDLEGGIAAEQRGSLVPLALVDIEAIDALQVLDLVLVLQQCGAMHEVCGPGRGT
jgi:hypothetical protein